MGTEKSFQGDWFDFVENRDGAWLAIADAAGKGANAAGLGAAVLGALRAARRSGYDLAEAHEAMHETVRGLGNRDFYVTALVARWRAATSTFTWVNCGHPNACLVDTDGTRISSSFDLRRPATKHHQLKQTANDQARPLPQRPP